MQKHPQMSCVWIEDESRRIGQIFIPEYFHNEMRATKVVVVMISDKERKKILLAEYAGQPDDELMESVELLRKRLGGLLTQQAIESIKAKDFAHVIDLLLPYYDKLYNYGLSQRPKESLIEVDLSQLTDKERLVKLSEVRRLVEQNFFG